MDDFWKKVYEVFMTQVPDPRKLPVDKIFETLRKTPNLPGIPDLPQAPEWLKHYEQYTKDYPLASEIGNAQAPSGQPGFSLWDSLHPEGVGSTNRSFNAIYPPLGR